MTQSARSGPEKGKCKGYWQAIANYNHALNCHVASLPHDGVGEQTLIDIGEQGEAHPEFGEFLQGLAQVHVVISETYEVPLDEVTADIEALDEAHDLLLDIYDAGQDLYE